MTNAHHKGKPATASTRRQVSPPDDLSTNVVRDLYMTLNPGEKIEGSFKIGSNAK